MQFLLKNKIAQYISLAVMIVIFAVAFLSYSVAVANPSEFCSKNTSGATSSPAYMTAGTATTTLTLDNCSDERTAIDTASLLIHFSSSTTPPTLKWRYQFSQDNIDWYEEDVALNSNATTTEAVRTFHEYSWLYASTTPLAGGTSEDALKLVTVPVPTRYVRAVFYLPAGSSPADVWADFIVKRETSER